MTVRCSLAVAFILSFLLTPVTRAGEETPAAGLIVSADFPGGSAEVQAVDAAGGMVHICPAVHEGRGWPCWWYLRIDGLAPGQQVTLKVSGNPKPFRDKQRLSANWSQPQRAAISADNETWSQTPKRELTADKIAIYRFDAPGKTVWLASQPPFLPSHADALLERIASRTPDAERFVLTNTREGRPVQGIKLGGGTAEEPAPLAVWVQARQHAWESGASWVSRGFIEWAAGDDPAAAQLRRMASVYVIPIMDVDNVTLGAGGKDAVPRDHNRDWSDQPVYPEVAAAQQRIRDLDGQSRLRVFVDLHNPGPGEPRPYFFGPLDLAKMPAPQQHNYARLLALTAECMRDPLPMDSKYKFATYVKTEEERGRVSGTWVRNHTGDNVVAASLETVWDTPHSTPDGYQAVGRQLAQAVARYLAEAPWKAGTPAK
ncbi:MAG TPA: M14 family zinc carboxypeptidase [Candidatus Anammoximicrobium sp.]|nr:M14 family zinc carboxypeptidase [Candidatus Anammoximicrobium sp.]